jgi:hemerythrin-like domain-containing protein
VCLVGGAHKQGSGSGPGEDDDALDLLERSHRRLEERLSELRRAATAIVRERAGEAELAMVETVIEYLRRSAARHEEDEEESLFPRLRTRRGAADLGPLLQDLTADHVLHRHLIKQLRSLQGGWPASGPDAGDGAKLVTLANELSRSYRQHIAREDRELLPAARERLSGPDRDAIRAEMGQRRGGHAHGNGRRRRPAGSTGPRSRVREV